jgi:hypothetical protein
VVQAETHKSVRTNTTPMTRFHQVGEVVQAGHMVVSSRCLQPLLLPMCGSITFEEPSARHFIPSLHHDSHDSG